MPNVLRPARGQRSLRQRLQPHSVVASCAVKLIITRLPRRCGYSYRQVSTREKRGKKEQCLGSAPCQRRVSAVHICNSNAVAGVLRQDCAGPSTSVSLLAHCEEVVSDSRWGCSPIRLRLLEDDEWGWLRGAREKWRHRQTRDAHSCLGE